MHHGEPPPRHTAVPAGAGAVPARIQRRACLATAALLVAACSPGRAPNEPVPPNVRGLNVQIVTRRPGADARVGDTLAVFAQAMDAAGLPVVWYPSNVRWSLSDPTLATIVPMPNPSVASLLYARAPGFLTVTATAGRVTGQDTVRILPRSPSASRAPAGATPR